MAHCCIEIILVDEIKDYLRKLIDQGITIIPNTSKTEKEIEEFTKELGLEHLYLKMDLQFMVWI